MNQIKTEKGKRIWPWLLGGLFLVTFLIYFLSYREKKEIIGQEQVTDLSNMKENNSTITTFINFIKEDSTNKMNRDHDYTSNALIKLADAVKAIAHDIGYNLNGDLDTVKEYAIKITEDPSSTAHADYIRKSADILTDVLQNMQQAKYSGLSNEVTELINKFASINPDVLTLKRNTDRIHI